MTIREMRSVPETGHTDEALADDQAYAVAARYARKAARHHYKAERLAERILAQANQGSSPALNFKARDEEVIERDIELGFLSAGLGDVNLDTSGRLGVLEAGWLARGFVSLDANIVQNTECPGGTSRSLLTPEGQLEVLDDSCFYRLNLARALGATIDLHAQGAMRLLIADPSNEKARTLVAYYNNTIFASMLAGSARVRLDYPETVVGITLQFANSCIRIRSAASLLAQCCSSWFAKADNTDGDHSETPAIADGDHSEAPAIAITEALKKGFGKRGEALLAGMPIPALLTIDAMHSAFSLVKLSGSELDEALRH